MPMANVRPQDRAVRRPDTYTLSTVDVMNVIRAYAERPPRWCDNAEDFVRNRLNVRLIDPDNARFRMELDEPVRQLTVGEVRRAVEVARLRWPDHTRVAEMCNVLERDFLFARSETEAEHAVVEEMVPTRQFLAALRATDGSGAWRTALNTRLRGQLGLHLTNDRDSVVQATDDPSRLPKARVREFLDRLTTITGLMPTLIDRTQTELREIFDLADDEYDVTVRVTASQLRNAGWNDSARVPTRQTALIAVRNNIHDDDHVTVNAVTR